MDFTSTASFTVIDVPSDGRLLPNRSSNASPYRIPVLCIQRGCERVICIAYCSLQLSMELLILRRRHLGFLHWSDLISVNLSPPVETHVGGHSL